MAQPAAAVHYVPVCVFISGNRHVLLVAAWVAEPAVVDYLCSAVCHRNHPEHNLTLNVEERTTLPKDVKTWPRRSQDGTVYPDWFQAKVLLG